MQVTAQASVGRAIVAVDPANVTNRNLLFDPRLTIESYDLSETDGTGRQLVIRMPGLSGDPYISDGALWAYANTSGGGARLRVLAHPSTPAGTALHGLIRVAQIDGRAAPDWQVRFTRGDGSPLGGAALLNGPGTLTFTGTVGPAQDTYIELVSTNGAPFRVTLGYAGTTPRTVGTVFSGSDPATSSAVYQWAGTIGRSISEEVLTADHETISVHRVEGERLVPIRGYQHVPAVGAAISDNDVPLRVGVFYQVTTGSGLRFFSNVVVVQPSPPTFRDPDTWPILSNPITGHMCRVVLVSWDTIRHATDKVRVRVPGRRSPVVISDVEASGEAEIVVETRTREDRETLAALLADGSPLLLRCPCPDIDDAYVDVESRTITRILKHGWNERREHSLTVALIDPPHMDIRGMGDTLGDLYAVTYTLQDIADRWATLGDIAAADLIGGQA